MKKKKDYPARNRKYPWSKWLDGDWHEIIAGTDFLVPINNMRSQILLYARKHNMTVETRLLVCGKKLALKKSPAKETKC